MSEDMLLPISVGDPAERVRAHYDLTPARALAGADGLPCYEVGDRIAFYIDLCDRVGRIHVRGQAIAELGLDAPLAELTTRFAPLLRVWSLDDATAHLFASETLGRVRFDIDAETQRPRDVFLFGGRMREPRELPITIGTSLAEVRAIYDLAFDPVPDPDPALGSAFELPSEGLVIRFDRERNVSAIRIAWGNLEGVSVSDTLERVYQVKGSPTREWPNMENTSLLYPSTRHGRVRFDVNDESLRVVSIRVLGPPRSPQQPTIEDAPRGAVTDPFAGTLAAAEGDAVSAEISRQLGRGATVEAPSIPNLSSRAAPAPSTRRATSDAAQSPHLRALTELRDALQWSARWVDSACTALARWPLATELDSDAANASALKTLLSIDLGEAPPLGQRRAAFDWLRQQRQQLERWRNTSLVAAALDVASEPLTQTMRLSHLAFGSSWPALMEAQMMQEKARRIGRFHEEVLYRLALVEGFIDALKEGEIIAHDTALNDVTAPRALVFEAFLLGSGEVLRPERLPALGLKVPRGAPRTPDHVLFLEYCLRECSALSEVLKGREVVCARTIREIAREAERVREKRQEWEQWHALALRASDQERAETAMRHVKTHVETQQQLDAQQQIFDRCANALRETLAALRETLDRAREAI